MCRSAEIRCFHQQERDRLKIRGFYLRLSISNPHNHSLIPESLTLVYLPRINGNPLDVNDSKIRSDSAAFVTLYRTRSAEEKENDVVFASRERVRASEGVQFVVYVREEKLLKGIFRKDEEDEEEWKMDCKSTLESELVGFEVREEAEVCVAVEGHVAMIERVKMVVRRRRKTRGFLGLEEIPEEREVELETDSDESCSSCGEMEMESSSDGGDCGEKEIEMEGVRWAVDVGIWVVCLGVGYLVSKASSKSLRRRMFL